MTTRDQLRRAVGVDRGDSARGETVRGLSVDPAPSLPERFLAARERKGVDLYRAERDTKIRARYLAALERGDYRELPGAVYTKGFLRNYALYLGLDPDDVLLQWRRERGDGREQPTVIAVPRPIATPRRGLTFSPSLVVFALLTVAVLAFGVYLSVQLLRFAKPPTIAVTNPAAAVVEVDESTDSYVLRGTSAPGATISIATPGRDPYSVSADADGEWTATVELRRGRNQFDVTAVDPETGKRSEGQVALFITVPFLAIETPTLSVDQPAEGATYENGAIPVQGRATNATKVVVSATYSGPATPPAEGAASPVPPALPAPVTVPVAEDGSYSAPFELTAGKWALKVTASGQGTKAVALSRNVTVAYKGVTVAVTVKGGKAWLKVWVDGKASTVTGAAGKVYSAGKVLTFTGRDDIEVRTGNMAATYFTVNGVDVGRMSDRGNPGTWLFAPPAAPERTDNR
ncbi:MAG TPA: helix-turn-helix domain-containing protein [Candidatus Saccharimonadales bacterium]|nr:helix-turn-helix domain-containing protein [Candidatus Saccharimonadales bacterium]